MEPKQQAKELIEEMYNSKDQLRKYPMCIGTAKECAKITVKLILTIPYLLKSEHTFYKEVLKEIENYE